MKKFLILIVYFSYIIVIAQQEASVTFDEQTGNYIIEYMGYPNYSDEDYDGGKALVQLIFEPSTKIVPSVKSVVSFISDSNKYNYYYKVTNNVESEQRLQSFDIELLSSISTVIQPTQNWLADFYSFVDIFGWFNSKGTGGISHPLNGIPPDSTVTGFAFNSSGLPSITKAYFKGKPTIYLSFPDESNDTIQRKLRKLRKFPNNSVIRKTIGPKDLSVPFIQSEFIDTITIYSDSSYALSWIKDEQTRDKYDNYFNTAKTYLEQGDSSKARAELQKVLTDCNTDSATVLTSEAYALLYFNTEYLVNKLPEGEPGLPVKLEDSQGNLLQGGSLQYYDAGWKDAIDNGDGTFTVQTEKSTVSLKMTYAGGSQQKDNVTVGADTAVFQTSDITVKLLSSSNTLLDSGFVQYYAGGWQDFGALVNGVAHKELLSKNYNFKMKYAGSEKNHVQNLDTNTTVTFHTVNTEVQLRDSQNNLLPGGTVEYYASGWKEFGEATNGKANKELLSRSYTFKMHYANVENNLVQDLDSSTTVVFRTVNTTVQLKDSQENILNGDSVKYYASGWQYFGIPVNGSVSKELLPKQYNFKMYYGGADKNIVQNLDTNTTVTFHTVNAEVQLRDSQGNLLDGGTVEYYATGWKDFGEATNGTASKELLPREYTFKMNYGGLNTTKDQDVSANNTVTFNTSLTTVKVKDDQNQPVENAEVFYYGGSWRQIGFTVNVRLSKKQSKLLSYLIN